MTGIKSVAETDIIVDEEDNTVKLNAAALDTENVTFEGEGFSFVLGEDVVQSPGESDATLTNFEIGTATYGTLGKTDRDGNDVIIPIGNASITIKDAKARSINFIDANNADNEIYAGDGGSQLLGGSCGNDNLIGGKTLSGDAGNDVFVYSQGSVTITDYTAGADKISLDGAKISDVNISGDNVVLRFGDENSLTLQNAATKKITFVQDRTSTQYLFGNGKIFNTGKSAATITASVGKKFDAASYLSPVTIDAADDDKISLGAGANVSSFSVSQNGDIVFKVGSNKITVKNSDGLSEDGNETSATYFNDRAAESDGITLPATFKKKNFHGSD